MSTSNILGLYERQIREKVSVCAVGIIQWLFSFCQPLFKLLILTYTCLLYAPDCRHNEKFDRDEGKEFKIRTVYRFGHRETRALQAVVGWVRKWRTKVKETRKQPKSAYAKNTRSNIINCAPNRSTLTSNFRSCLFSLFSFEPSIRSVDPLFY